MVRFHICLLIASVITSSCINHSRDMFSYTSPSLSSFTEPWRDQEGRVLFWRAHTWPYYSLDPRLAQCPTPLGLPSSGDSSLQTSSVEAGLAPYPMLGTAGAQVACNSYSHTDRYSERGRERMVKYPRPHDWSEEHEVLNSFLSSSEVYTPDALPL